MALNKCNLCFNNINNTSNHDNCKYQYFDILKNLFKSEICDIQTKLNNKIKVCIDLQDLNDKLMNENEVLKLNIKKLENDRLDDKKSYELAPDTPPTQIGLLDRGMMVDETSNDESCKENLSDKFQRNANLSSPDEKKSNFLDIPRRKKIPFRMSSPKSADKTKILENKWISKGSVKKNNIGFSFIQPMHKLNGSDKNDSLAKSNFPFTKISLNKSKKLKQTQLNFNKPTDNLDNSNVNHLGSNDETYCDDVIMPTPQNVLFTRTIRSSTSSSSISAGPSPEKKIFDFQLKPKELSNITNSDSVEFMPIDDEIIFVSGSTNATFDSDSSINSCDLLDKYSMEFAKEEIRAEKDMKTHKPNVLRNKTPLDVHNEYQITSPIRKNSEKAKRPGFDCPDCEKYYQIIGMDMSDTELQKRMNKCSKHRKNQRLHLTPEGFWNPVFTPTQ